ncbi:MAG TPA: hypothetical protein PLZ84_01505 [Clostridia bacterium]|nr:hypothetical protein [Clostridia bacterium]
MVDKKIKYLILPVMLFFAFGIASAIPQGYVKIDHQNLPAQGAELVVTKDGVNLRHPDTGQVIQGMSEGTILFFMEYGLRLDGFDDVFVRVLTQNDTQGLCSAEYLAYLPDEPTPTATPSPTPERTPTPTSALVSSPTPTSAKTPDITPTGTVTTPQQTPTPTFNPIITPTTQPPVDLKPDYSPGLIDRLKSIPLWVYAQLAIAIVVLFAYYLKKSNDD